MAQQCLWFIFWAVTKVSVVGGPFDRQPAVECFRVPSGIGHPSTIGHGYIYHDKYISFKVVG